MASGATVAAAASTVTSSLLRPPHLVQSLQHSMIDFLPSLAFNSHQRERSRHASGGRKGKKKKVTAVGIAGKVKVSPFFERRLRLSFSGVSM